MISVVIPTYNRAKVISNVLDNLLLQTNPNWQCIVVDDYSIDNTAEVVQHYVAKDSRFVYLTNIRKKGAQGARNTGILAAEGDWICLFDSDDVMYPDYIERMQTEIEQGGADVIACYANIRSTQTGQVQGRLDKIDIGNLHTQLLKEKSYVAYDVCVIRKQKILDIGLLDENCPSMQEWDTHIRLTKSCKYHLIPEILCDWMVGADDTISQDNQKHYNGMLYIYRKHAREFRKYAYSHFLRMLNGMRKNLPDAWRIFLWAPELIIYIPLCKILRK